jgi:hypothetical protein
MRGRGKMKKIVVTVFFIGVLSVASAASAGVPGVTDRSPAPTLLVPFFETGINATINPHDTLLVVTNVKTGAHIVHYHVWDIDANPTGIQGNITLNPRVSWTTAMRNLIAGASPADRSLLTDGDFYRGFVTIDIVTSGTTLLSITHDSQRDRLTDWPWLPLILLILVRDQCCRGSTDLLMEERKLTHVHGPVQYN